MDFPSTPVDTKSVGDRCVQVVTTDWSGKLIMAPGRQMRRWALAMFLMLPILLYLCYRFDAPGGLWAGAVLASLGGAGSFLVGDMVYARLGTRVVLDPRARTVAATGLVHAKRPETFSFGQLMNAVRDTEGRLFRFDDVAAIQLLDARRAKLGNSHYRHGYQLNLCLMNGTRYNLLDCHGKSRMQQNAQVIADCLRVKLIREVASEP